MPLSEEENRLLEQMERALAAEDPKLASAMRGRTLERTAKLRAVGAGVIFLGGVALLLAGAMAQMTWVGIVGFVVMLVSATVGLTAWRGRRAPREVPPGEARFDEGAGSHPAQGQRGFSVIDGGKAHKPRRPRKARQQRGGTFLQRMEQRWQHRREQGY